jgi:hypothetical protein
MNSGKERRKNTEGTVTLNHQIRPARPQYKLIQLGFGAIGLLVMGSVMLQIVSPNNLIWSITVLGK